MSVSTRRLRQRHAKAKRVSPPSNRVPKGNPLETYTLFKEIANETATYFFFRFNKPVFLQFLNIEPSSLPNADGEYIFVKGIFNKETYTDLHPITDTPFLMDYFRYDRSTSGATYKQARIEYNLRSEPIIMDKKIKGLVTIAIFQSTGASMKTMVKLKFTRYPKFIPS